MIPQYIRVVFPQNKSLQVLVPSQRPTLQYLRPPAPEQIRLITPVGFVSPLSSESSSLQSDTIPMSSPFSLDCESQTTQKQSLSAGGVAYSVMPSLSSTVVDVVSTQNIAESNALINTTQIKNKRSKNWSEEETSTFISVWSEYYDKLTAGGSRNMPIYNAMAQQLNSLFAPRVISGNEVKVKIFNIVSEYRKRKKEQGKSGGSPTTWRYYNQVDKFLGERPYNDDSLMSDTMTTQHDEVIDEIDNATIKDLNAYSVAEEGDNLLNLFKENEEIAKENVPSKSNSPSTSTCTQKNTTQSPNDSSTTKNHRKKKVADVRVEYERQKRKKRRALFFRNMLINQLQFLINQSLNNYTRTTWTYLKSGYWWLNIVPNMNDKQFKDNFRIQRNTFKQLLHQIEPYLKKQDTVLRSAVPVDKRLACALYSLGSTSELRTIAHLFGIGKCTAANILHDFCDIIVELFFHRLIKFPVTNQEIKQTTDVFLDKYGYPMCIGSIDGTHISIEPPTGEETDYYNYKKFHSVIVLAVVDASLKFSYINVGAPGRCNDAFVYSRSTLFEVLQNSVYSKHYLTVNNVKIQSHLIGDSAFPLSKNLIKPYTERPNMPQHQSLFNYRLSRCRCTVERAFGQLKNRFRSIHKKMEFNIEHVKNIIKAACILHNICIDAQDAVETDWNITIPSYNKPTCNLRTIGAVDVRDALSFYFLQNPL
ncbi:unnamed protein product [Rotaria sp. Silwood2]|nr:unnamed protein product [Rotaria sp. Silwood2]CAF4416592.1 unnamed protein product [Rotaria sp. Silwood2]